MSLPENTESRSEQYLRAIATGDNSGLPPFPQSRMEEYLDYIVKNGGGGGGGNILFVGATTVDETTTLDKTWQEIMTAVGTGIAVIKKTYGENDITLDYINAVYHYDGNSYTVLSVSGDEYDADSASGYPVKADAPK